MKQKVTKWKDKKTNEKEMKIDPSQKPTLLSYCCYVRQAMLHSQYTCSHTVRNRLQNKEETDNTPAEQVTSGMNDLSFQIWTFF